MSATPFATYYYGRGALLGHSLMQPPAPHHWQPLHYPKSEEVAKKRFAFRAQLAGDLGTTIH
jgi:hypothetical protein